MTQKTVGLSIQDAFAEAVAEDSLSGETSVEPDSSPATNPEPSDVEQPDVESVENRGLFSGLDDINKQDEEQPDPRDSMHPVKVRGETLMVSYDELIAGYSRHEDYTRDKQEVSRLRAEADDALTLMKALQENPVPTVRRLWESVSQGQSLGNQGQFERKTVQAKDDVDIESMIQAKVNEALSNDPRIQAWENQQLMDEVNNIFSAIERDWGLDPLTDDDKVAVLEEVQRTNSNDVEATFAKMMHKKMLRDKELENAAANSTSTGYGGAGPSIVQVPRSNQKFGSFREAMNDTFAEENIDSKTLDQIINNL